MAKHFQDVFDFIHEIDDKTIQPDKRMNYDEYVQWLNEQINQFIDQEPALKNQSRQTLSQMFFCMHRMCRCQNLHGVNALTAVAHEQLTKILEERYELYRHTEKGLH